MMLGCSCWNDMRHVSATVLWRQMVVAHAAEDPWVRIWL